MKPLTIVAVAGAVVALSFGAGGPKAQKCGKTGASCVRTCAIAGTTAAISGWIVASCDATCARGASGRLAVEE
jgi:hypothetical protein